MACDARILTYWRNAGRATGILHARRLTYPIIPTFHRSVRPRPTAETQDQIVQNKANLQEPKTSANYCLESGL